MSHTLCDDKTLHIAQLSTNPLPRRFNKYVVKREVLVKIIKQDFGLTIDIEELINKIDQDGSGEIEFEEFKVLLSS